MIAAVRAYKFLTAERKAAITGFSWPKAAWVEAVGPLQRCGPGVHACRPAHLPHWIGPELWEMDVEGEMLETPDGVVARRGRLGARIDAWSGGVAQEFAEDCARRAAALAEQAPSAAGRAEDAAAFGDAGWVSAAAYIAAAVAGETFSGSRGGAEYQRHFLDERARQATWLRDRLSLAG